MLNPLVAEPHHDRKEYTGNPGYDEERNAGFDFAAGVAGFEAGVVGGLADDGEDHCHKRDEADEAEEDGPVCGAGFALDRVVSFSQC